MIGLQVKYKSGYHKNQVFEVLSEPLMDPTFGIPVVVLEKNGVFVTEHITKLVRATTENPAQMMV